MMVRMKKMEKEKQEMLRQYQLLEEELDTRRREIFILKREDSAQYMQAERENWKALLTQQKQVNAKLEKGLIGVLI
jgi:singapore isolate B (sub-type 7) whole genome shotgun sequence assembly, scaffold_4